MHCSVGHPDDDGWKEVGLIWLCTAPAPYLSPNELTIIILQTAQKKDPCFWQIDITDWIVGLWQQRRPKAPESQRSIDHRLTQSRYLKLVKGSLETMSPWLKWSDNHQGSQRLKILELSDKCKTGGLLSFYPGITLTSVVFRGAEGASPVIVKVS